MTKSDANPQVDILLATYNGEAFLPELLRSLEKQTYENWRLIVRDDGSTDSTVRIIRQWATGCEGRVRIIEDRQKNLGASGNFSILMVASDAPYFMFCDQDDVWLPEKISLLLETIQSTEADAGNETPVLVHSDMVVVDSELNQISPSAWRYSQRSNMESANKYALLLENDVTGCALIGNRALGGAASPVPNAAYLHDWWVALVAQFLGKIGRVTKPTVLYRQHGTNSIGAKSWNLPDLIMRLIGQPFAGIARTRNLISITRRQAAVFLEIHGDRLDPASFRVVEDFSRMNSQSFLQRKLFLIRNGLLPDNGIRAAVLLLLF